MNSYSGTTINSICRQCSGNRHELNDFQTPLPSANEWPRNSASTARKSDKESLNGRSEPISVQDEALHDSCHINPLGSNSTSRNNNKTQYKPTPLISSTRDVNATSPIQRTHKANTHGKMPSPHTNKARSSKEHYPLSPPAAAATTELRSRKPRAAGHRMGLKETTRAPVRRRQTTDAVAA